MTPAASLGLYAQGITLVHADVREISKHMKEFGLSLLGRSIRDATFSEMLNPYVHAMAVTTCAHAAEIIVKARISEEHPLLIFDKLPRPDPSSFLDVAALMAQGRTLSYEELPDALWATTGYRLSNRDQFDDFGKLRNTIIHFAVPDIDLSDSVLRFAFGVIEPMVYDFWKTDIIENYEQFGEEAEHLIERLKNLNIPFTPRTCR
jgi:hypothetical protein